MMSLYTFTTSAVLPSIQLPEKLIIEECTDIALLTVMCGTTSGEVVQRLANDNVAFMAYIDGEPAAFGWMARGKAKIGELNHEMVLPVGNRYLWNFRTVERFRGLGIYPALLQYIIHWETERADQFWIAHAPENTASLKGIRKSGFHYVGKLYNIAGVAAIENTILSQSNSGLLTEMGIVISKEEPASCWNCSSPYVKNRRYECCCAVTGNECAVNHLLSLAI